MDKVILYGAGTFGEEMYQYLEHYNLTEYIYAYCDKNAATIKTKCGKKVLSYDEAKSLGIPFIIAVKNEPNGFFNEIKELLDNDNVVYYDKLLNWLRKHADLTQISREYCANNHITGMDDYFEKVESPSSLARFWASDSIFYKMFKNLDLTHVVELACGRGRHVQMYLQNATDITLVDILDKNIDIVKERYKDYTNIHYYKNNGYDLSELPSEKYTSLFTYDAMVHFEFFDVFNYLKETYRILTPGGYALFHHSNDSSDYTNSFANCSNRHGRNFMDKKLFAFLAYRAGFEIIEQQVIDWGTKDIDCITLVKK